MSYEDEPVVKVHMVRNDTATPCPEAKKYPERYLILNTYVPAASPELILPHAPKRCRWWITGIGVVGTNGNFVLATSESNAQQASNATTPLRSNAVMPPNAVMHGESQNEMWLVGPYATPGLVSVVAEYER